MFNKKLLIIGFVWPEPNSSAAGSRMLQLIQQFQKQGFDITFVTTANESDKAFDLSPIDVKTASIALNNSSFDDFVKEFNPIVVLFDRFMTEEQFGWRVAEQCPNAIRILDTEDVHGLRKGRAIALKENADFSIEHLQNDTTKREVASIYRCDLSLIISEAEIDILVNQLKVDRKLLYYLPFLIDPITKNETEQFPVFEKRQHFVTIGNFLHAPNYDAVLYLKQTIWPLIRRQLPKAELHVYGAYESQKVLQLHHQKDGFLIKGFVKDVDVVMQNSRVCLAPLRFGAGLKGKLIDAMKSGTPCMMSSIAAEGMFGELEANGFVEDNSEAFAQKAIDLYTNETVWKDKQTNGFKVLNSRFNIKNFETGFVDRLNDLKQNLNTYRQQNFTGQLLMHHTLQSTKYMSKWIEEKNK
ncbi:glycosyltransferase [uncultured Winogradskyella sp.]|uniref:glycosyltransferase n=1 Tax=uncultured Winogradskyella sp. TaxID=395353 RepID=UPI00262B777A|nr:glycosyltransferase [uncultured Winogradskyella sp.]